VNDGDANSCCAYLSIIDCGDTKDHSHLFCEYYQAIYDNMIDMPQVLRYCISSYADCIYKPNTES